MFESLRIRNFQCHRRIKIVFDPLVTVLVGASDVGKSAILRSLKYLCTNRPGGSGFISHGAKFAKVSLTVDGHTVTRSKGAKNLYRLDDQSYTAFGSDVPTDIQTLLNVGMVNFAGQLDSPFWFLKSPGEVAKELNAVVNLDLIDHTQANLAAVLRKARTEVEVCQGRLKENTAKRDSLAWTEEMYERLLSLSEQERLLEEEEARIISLRRLIEEIGRLMEVRDRAAEAMRRALGVKRAWEKVQQTAEEVQVLEERVESLRNLLQRLTDEQERVCQLQENLRRRERELAKKIGKNCPLCHAPLRSSWPASSGISTLASGHP